MSTFGTGSTNTGGSSIILTTFEGTNGAQAGTDGLVPGPAIAQAGYLLGAGGDWTLSILGGIALNDSSNRVATTQFVQQVVAGAALGGNANLSALLDVDLTANGGLADDHFLQYNAGNLKWENTPLTISLISDVNLAGLANGNTLVWDAVNSEWIPGAGGGGGGAANLTDLGDVTIAGVALNHFLVNNGAGQFVNRVISTADLSDSANIALLNANQTFTGDVRAITQALNDDSTRIATTAYVSNEIFSEINALNLGTASQSAVGDFLASNASIADLSDVDSLAGIQAGDVLAWTANNRFEFTAPAVTYTDEEARDSVGAALAGGNHTGISFVNNDAGDTIDATVSLAGFSVGDLSDVDTTTNAPVVGEVLKWDGNKFVPASDTAKTQEEIEDIVGGMVAGNTETGISVTYADNGAGAGKLDFVVDNTVVGFLGGAQTFTGDKTFTGAVDLTASTATASLQAGGTNNTSLATTSFVQQEITALNLGTASQSAVGDFLASNSGLDDLSDVTLNLPAVGHFLVHDGNDFKNRVIASSDLSDTANIALLNANQTFTGDVDFTGGAYTADAPANNAVGREIATASFVRNVVAQVGNVSQLNDLADVTIGGVALAQNQVLVYTGNNVFENVGLASTQLSDTADLIRNTSSVGDLSDVNVAGVAGGNVLTWNAVAGEFQPSAPAVTYTDEEARDAAGTALANGAHTGISFVNNDAGDTIEATVSLAGFSVGALSDVNLAGVANGKILKWDNGSFVVADDNQLTDEQVEDLVGVMFTANNAGNTHITFSYDDTGGANDGTITATVSLASTDLTDTANIARLNQVQTFSANATFTADVDLTGANATATTQGASDNSTKVATTAYVDAQIDADILALNLGTTYQAIDASLDTITGIADGDLLLGNGVDTFEKVSVTAGVETFLKSDGNVGNLADVSVANPADKHFLVHNGAGSFVNRTISTGDLSDEAGIALTTRATTFGAFAYNFEAGTLTSATPALATDDTTVATTAWVNDVMQAAGNVTSIDDLDDVLIAGVANAQILVFDADGGADDNQWKNVSLSGDISISNAGVATIGNDKVTTLKILDGNVTEGKIGAGAVTEVKLGVDAVTTLKIKDANVTNAKLANSSLTIGSTSISLGATSTTLGGMTGVDFTNADATIGASMTTNLGNPTTLTLGGAGSKVVVTGDLQVNGATTTVNTTNLDVSDQIISLNNGVAGANADDIGLFLDRGTSDPALLFWDEGDASFKVATHTGAVDSSASDFSSVAGLTLASLQASTPAQGDDSNLVSTTAWVNDYFQPLDATLTALAGVATQADKLVYADGVDSFATTDISAFGRTLIANANAGDTRTDLGLVIGTDVQAQDATLQSISALGTGAGKTLYTTGVDTWAETDITAFSRTLLDDANALTARATLGLTIGTDVQAQDATLQSISTLGTGAGKYLYTTGVDTWAEGTLTAFSQSLLDDANAGEARTTLGLGTSAVEDVTAFLRPAQNLNDLANKATSRQNLGVEIGVNVQAYDPTLTALAGVNTVADRLIYATGVDTFSVTTLTAFGRTILDDADAPTARATLGLVIGTNVQAQDATLQSISTLGTGAGKYLYTTGVDTWAEGTISAFAQTLLDDANALTARATLGLVIGTDVQAQDATLQSLSLLGTGADKIAYTTGVDTWAETSLSAFSRTLLDDGDAQTARATLGLGTSAVEPVGTFAQVANNLSDLADAPTARNNLGLGNVATLDTTINGGVADAGKALVADAQGKLGAIDGSNLTALGSIGLHANVDLTGLQDNQGLVYNAATTNFEPGTIPTTGTDVGESPTITAQSISLNPNALIGGDLVIYGRVMEVIDYGSVANAFGAGDFALDFGGDLTDTVLYSAEDYGVLVP